MDQRLEYCYNDYDHIHSFIHSGHFYSASSSHLLLRGAPDYSTDTVSEFHAEAHSQATVGKGLAQGHCMAVRAGVEPTILQFLRLKAIDSTKAPPCPIIAVLTWDPGKCLWFGSPCTIQGQSNRGSIYTGLETPCIRSTSCLLFW